MSKHPIAPEDRRWISTSKQHYHWLKVNGRFKRNKRSMDDIVGDLIKFFVAEGGKMPLE